MKKHPTAAATGLSPAMRRYFYFTAALTGAAIMIVEILGAKMLSPYIGTSHFVWTAQIAVTLIALAMGYYAGGVLVDRSQRVARLYWAIFFAAIYLTLTIVACEPVAYWSLGLKPFALASLVASFFLFFVPLALLAMVGPFFVRVLTSAVSDVGGNVGRLTAISTLGSFAGTMLIGYVLIPFLPNSRTMFMTALVLMAVCLGYFAVWGRKHSLAPGITALVVGLIVGFLGVRADRLRHTSATEKFYGNSNFGMLQVLDVGSTRYYLNDYLTQNTYDPAEGKSTSLFTYMLHGLARVYTSNIHDALCIGVGVGIVPMQFAREGARVDAVEINPAVIPMARDWFGLEPDKLNIIIADGRQVLNQASKQYDTIALDAFLGESSPSHLMTREAFVAMRRVLKPGGTLVINSFGDLDPGESFFTASLYKTLTNVFSSVKIHSSGGGNTFFVAAMHRLEFVREPEYAHVHARNRYEVEIAYAGVVDPEDGAGGATRVALDLREGHVLTDDFNPVEFYDARNRERIRRSLALSMKRAERE